MLGPVPFSSYSQHVHSFWKSVSSDHHQYRLLPLLLLLLFHWMVAPTTRFFFQHHHHDRRPTLVNLLLSASDPCSFYSRHVVYDGRCNCFHVVMFVFALLFFGWCFCRLLRQISTCNILHFRLLESFFLNQHSSRISLYNSEQCCHFDEGVTFF
jgi:hypothetical protein